MIDTRADWLKRLEQISPFIQAYGLSATLKDAIYVERPAGQAKFHDLDAFNIANSDPHNDMIAEAVRALQNRMSATAIQSLIGELTSRKTYGAFCELLVYKWLGDAAVDFTAQVPMTSTDVLNKNGSTIDGKMTLTNGKTVCFDVKGFGFVAHKIKILQERLEKEFSGKSVLIEGAWNVSIDALQDLLDYTGFSALVQDLRNAAPVRRDTLEFRIQDRRPVTISMHENNPLRLAEENREYLMRFARQYTRQGPFLLVLVIHPWFSQGELHQNFGKFVDLFTRELSRLAFQSFQNDATLVEGLPRAEAAKLLSGLIFLNGWPATGTDAPRPSPFCRIFLNSLAAHRLVGADFASFQAAFPNDITVEEIP